MAKSLQLDVEIESAEAQYLLARVTHLRQLTDNPFGAETRTVGQLSAFLVKATPSPMLNRICGLGTRRFSDELPSLLAWFAARERIPAIPVIRPTASEGSEGTDLHLKTLRGWTHAQLAREGTALDTGPKLPKVDELGPEDSALFARIHAEAFHTKPDAREVNKESFEALLGSKRGRAFAAFLESKPVAVGLIFFANNGIAYFGTAGTLQSARKRGCHEALIRRRVAAAQEQGYRILAATALPSSQSSRTLTRLGFRVSHIQEMLTPV